MAGIETGVELEEGLDQVEDGTGEGEASMEALIAAATKASAEAGEGEEEVDQTGTLKTKAAPPKKAAPSSSVIAQELARREAKRSAEGDYQAKVAEANAAAAKAQEMVDRAHKYQLDSQKELADLQQAKKDPIAFMQKMGWDADTFINEAMRRKDPNFQAVNGAMEAELSKRDAVIAELRAGLAELQGVKKGYDNERETIAQQQATQEFWASIPKDSPLLTEEEQDVIIYKANKVGDEYKKRTGKVATPTQIGEYLHYQALQRRQGAAAKPAEQKPDTGKSKVKVPRSLGSTATSGRTSGPAKDFRDMTDAEQREYLIVVASQAVTGE